MVQISTPGVTPNRGMGPPWGAFCQITLTSCSMWHDNCLWILKGWSTSWLRLRCLPTRWIVGFILLRHSTTSQKSCNHILSLFYNVLVWTFLNEFSQKMLKTFESILLYGNQWACIFAYTFLLFVIFEIYFDYFTQWRHRFDHALYVFVNCMNNSWWCVVNVPSAIS